MNSLISIDDLDAGEVMRLVDRSVALHQDRNAHDRPLRGTVAGMMFLQTSTRTRTSFTVGAVRLGADVVTFGPADLQLNTGETLEDTGRVFGAMLDLLVVRTKGPSSDLEGLSDGGGLPVVNAMSGHEHPTQALTDLAAMRVRFGDLDGLNLLYMGEGNSSAVALAKALRHVPGARATFWTPPGYGLDDALVAACDTAAAVRGGGIRQISAAEDLPETVDVVYTTRWQTTGTVKPDPGWREAFRPLYIDQHLMRRWPDAAVMHDLPAHRGEEIAAGVLDGKSSIAWTQAAMKLSTAMAVLERAGRRGAAGGEAA